MKPKLVYVSTRCPWPASSGRDFMINQSLRAFEQIYDVTYVLIGDRVADRRSIRHVRDVIELPGPSIAEIALNVLSPHGRCLQEALFFSRRAFGRLNELLHDPTIEAVACDMVRTASYLPATGRFLTICDMDDLLSRRYEQMSALPRSAYSIFGTHASKPHFRMISAAAAPFMKWVLKCEAALIRRREVEIASSVDCVVLVSPKEALDLRRRTGEDVKIVSFPPAVMTQRSAQIQSDDGGAGDPPSSRAGVDAKALNLLFVGDMRTPGNSGAARYVLSRILPRLASLGVAYEMRFVGRANQDLSREISAAAHCVELGWVEDLEEVYRSADVVLCPFVTGTGIKVKILEAMSHARVVVTNAIGADGLSASSGEEIIVGNSDEEVIGAITMLREDHRLRRRIGNAAAQFIRRAHEPENLTGHFLLHLRGLRNDRAVTAP